MASRRRSRQPPQRVGRVARSAPEARLLGAEEVVAAADLVSTSSLDVSSALLPLLVLPLFSVDAVQAFAEANEAMNPAIAMFQESARRPLRKR